MFKNSLTDLIISELDAPEIMANSNPLFAAKRRSSLSFSLSVGNSGISPGTQTLKASFKFPPFIILHLISVYVVSKTSKMISP